MTPVSDTTTHHPDKQKSRLEVFAEELLVDLVITAAIVWGLVLLGEPLVAVLSSPLFLVLTAAGLTHVVVKARRHTNEPLDA